jgi:hypothetical protein
MAMEPTLSKLRPTIDTTGEIFYRRLDSIPRDICQIYGQKVLSGEACQRLLAGYAEYLAPLAKLLPESGKILSRGVEAAYAIEMVKKVEGQILPRAISIYPIYATPSGFCSFGLYHGTGPSPNPVQEDMDGFYKRVSHLPDFVQQLFLHYEHIYLHTASEYHGMPDVNILEKVTYGCSSIADILRGAGKRAMTKQFGDLYDITLLSSRYRESKDDWFVFFDNSDKGDQTLFIVMDEKFNEVRKLVNAQEAYDQMFAHYLSGKPGEFDFHPFTQLL